MYFLYKKKTTIFKYNYSFFNIRNSITTIKNSFLNITKKEDAFLIL